MNKSEQYEIFALMNSNKKLSPIEIQFFQQNIFYCDLNQKDHYGRNLLMYILHKNKELNFNSQWLNYFLKNSNLKETNNQDNSAIFMVFFHNKTQNLFFNEEQWNYLFQNSDLKHQDTLGFNPLMLAINYYKKEQLNFTEKQWDYLIQHSDLKQHNNEGINALMFALENKKNLPLNQKQWSYLIQHSDLKQQSNIGWTTLLYAFYYHQNQNLNLSKKEFQILYDALSEGQQQNTFQRLVEKNVENNHKYVEEINLLLYDLKFQPNQKTMNWLQKNNHQDILEMIEKRNLFFKLQQEISMIENQTKIATIKI